MSKTSPIKRSDSEIAVALPKLPGWENRGGKLQTGARIAVLGGKRFGGHSLLELLHAQGSQVILTEGGPSLVGQLLEEGLIDELFLTTSPRLFGRWSGDERKSLVEGFNLGGSSLKLSSERRHESPLYSRYSLDVSKHSK